MKTATSGGDGVDGFAGHIAQDLPTGSGIVVCHSNLMGGKGSHHDEMSRSSLDRSQIACCCAKAGEKVAGKLRLTYIVRDGRIRESCERERKRNEMKCWTYNII